MKGPGYRYDIDVRRTWLCPACGNRLRSRGEATARRCRCTDEGTWMNLVDENVRRTFPQRERIVIPEPDSDPEELEENELPQDTAETAVEVVPAPEEPAVAPEIDAPHVEPDPVEPEPATNVADPDSPPETTVESFEAPSSRRRRDKKRRRKNNRRRNNESPNETPSENATQEPAPSAEIPTPPAAESPPAPPENPAPPDSSDGGGFGENVFD